MRRMSDFVYLHTNNKISILNNSTCIHKSTEYPIVNKSIISSFWACTRLLYTFIVPYIKIYSRSISNVVALTAVTRLTAGMESVIRTIHFQRRKETKNYAKRYVQLCCTPFKCSELIKSNGNAYGLYWADIDDTSREYSSSRSKMCTHYVEICKYILRDGPYALSMELPSQSINGAETFFWLW